MTDDALGDTQFRGLYKDFTTAFENEDYDTLRKLYAPTAVMINPIGNVLSGRDAVVNFLQRAQRIQSVRFEALESFRLSDDVVRQVGDLTLTMRGQGRETREVPAKFLLFWTKVDGDWRIDSCVWSRRGGGQTGRGQAGGGRMGGGRMGGGGQGGGGGRMGGGGQGGGGGRMGGGGQGGGGGRMGGGQGGGRMGGGGGGSGGQGGGRMGGGGMRGGRMGLRGPSPDEGGAFNPRNLHRDDLAPLVPRID